MKFKILILCLMIITLPLSPDKSGKEIYGRYEFQGDCIGQPESFFIELRKDKTFLAAHATCEDIIIESGKYTIARGYIKFDLAKKYPWLKPRFFFKGNRLFPASKNESFDGCNHECTEGLFFYEKKK